MYVVVTVCVLSWCGFVYITPSCVLSGVCMFVSLSICCL